MKKIIEDLEKFAEENNISYAKIAKAINIGSSTLSEFRRGTYTGDVKALTEKVEAFLERHKKKMRRIDFSVDTEVKKRIFYAAEVIENYVASNVMTQTIDSAKIAYIYGRAGIGKTHALMEWARQYKGRALFITAETGITVVGLIKKIARELRIDANGNNTESIKQRIKDSVKFTETIIVIDEGEHLKPSIIDIVRSLADQTGVGIIIAGTEALKSKIYSQTKGYEYLYSRAVINMTLRELNIDDVSKIVKKFLKNEIDLYSEKELQEMISYINLTVRGSARQLANLLTLTGHISTNNVSVDGKLTLDQIKAAVTMLAINY
jgi:phage transposase